MVMDELTGKLTDSGALAIWLRFYLFGTKPQKMFMLYQAILETTYKIPFTSIQYKKVTNKTLYKTAT